VSRRAQVALRVIAALGLVLAAFPHLVGPARQVEAAVASRIVAATGAGEVSDVVPGAVVVFPSGGAPFRAVVTDSCSAAAPVLTLAGVAAFVLPGSRRRRTGALAVASGAVIVLNTARITASVAAGALMGRSGLVLFHDWVGTGMAFAATLVGLFLLVSLILPQGGGDGRRYADRLVVRP
jgi:exosortase/archaeosortase family protein